MRETKLDITNRLRKENRDGEAGDFRRRRIKELRAAGKRKVEAGEIAWQEMEDAYPPLPPTEEPEEDELETSPEFTAEQIAQLPPGSLDEFMSDADWVYSNLTQKEVDLEKAPSTGAVALLEWARENKNDFFSKVVPRVIAQLEKQDALDDAEEVEAMEIEKLIEELGIVHTDEVYSASLIEIPKPKATDGEGTNSC